jgi:hypothetical protein
MFLLFAEKHAKSNVFMFNQFTPSDPIRVLQLAALEHFLRVEC